MAKEKPEVRPESKIALTDRLRREGRFEEAMAFKDEVIKELRLTGMRKIEAGERAWSEMARIFPPLKSEDEVVAEPSAVVSDASFGMLPEDWPPLPETADWIDDLEWAYQNGFFVICEKATGAVTYRWERARTPPPSQGALVLMKLQAESRQKFMDLLGKAKTSSEGTETEGVKREKRRIEEIEALLEKLQEGSN